MEALKEKISFTVQMPQFLDEFSHPNKEEIVNGYYNILDIYFGGVYSNFLPNNTIRRWCRRVDIISNELLEITPPVIHLNSWIWIGGVVELWIEYSLQAEEYEVATNLRKLLNSEYV